tara:strand:+ start:4950 stop:5651 length:702 start_codon:yes stop_codon:yes gene_type:complete
MHKSFIPQHIKDRVRKVRGADHVFDSVDMSRTAHVIVDMQVGFCAEGAPIEVPMTRQIFPAINAVASAVRDAGGTNVFLRYTYDPAEKLAWDSWFKNYLGQTELDNQAQFARGATNWQLSPELEITADDLIIDKTRFSALIPETCDMDAQLKARGIDTLIITGTLTNCCCESTARDALQMGYKVIFLTDGNATLSDEEHNATLISMYTIFADVMDSDRLLSLIERAADAQAAA